MADGKGKRIVSQSSRKGLKSLSVVRARAEKEYYSGIPRGGKKNKPKAKKQIVYTNDGGQYRVGVDSTDPYVIRTEGGLKDDYNRMSFKNSAIDKIRKGKSVKK